MKVLAVLGVAVAVTGCSTVTPKAESERALAQALHEAAIRAAIGHTGAGACRQLIVGIAERDWVRGQVSRLVDDGIAVRVQDAGHFPKVLRGTPIVPGALLWAAPSAWTPCV